MIRRQVWKCAFTATLPVLMGYLTMGAAAGILLAGALPHLPGTTVLWAFLSSAGSISGAQQFLLTGWIKALTSLIDIVLLSIFLNLRYAMYGLSLIEKFRKLPLLLKFYLIWSLTDETYALEVSGVTGSSSTGGNVLHYCLAVGFLDHLYWVIGVTAGALIGSALPFDMKGIDFAMTALFLVVLTDQCREKANRIPALIGSVSASAVLLFLPPGKMLIPAMVLMLLLFAVFRKKLERKQA